MKELIIPNGMESIGDDVRQQKCAWWTFCTYQSRLILTQLNRMDFNYPTDSSKIMPRKLMDSPENLGKKML